MDDQTPWVVIHVRGERTSFRLGDGAELARWKREFHMHLIQTDANGTQHWGVDCVRPDSYALEGNDAAGHPVQ